MSVLSCARFGCPNIMCDRLSYEYGYICDECFDELLLRKMSDNTYPISDFMDTRKSEEVPVVAESVVYDYLNNEFAIQ